MRGMAIIRALPLLALALFMALLVFEPGGGFAKEEEATAIAGITPPELTDADLLEVRSCLGRSGPCQRCRP